VGLYVAVLALGLARRAGAESAVARLGRATAALVLLQWFAGVLNIALLAPISLQLGHLLLADAVWIALVLTAAADFGVTESPADREMRAGDTPVGHPALAGAAPGR
jgi:heme A synthase